MSTTWDPTRYLRYDSERSRPFIDLLARVDVNARHIVDLGCGPGHLTQMLRRRWPQAEIVGVDSSPQMIERARTEPDDRVRYELADLREWRPEGPVDLLVSNATFQWVPGHLQLLPDLADRVASRGALAFSVPGNFTAPSHQILHALAAEELYEAYGRPDERPNALDAAAYLDLLSRPGWSVDAWETTYLHVLQGPDPVFEWISGTGARPVLESLPADLVAAFSAEFKARLRAAYPAQSYGTVLPFRRVFVVAHRSNQ